MTFSAIVSKVLAKTNETSTTATTRVGTYVNDRYREVRAGVGMETSNDGTVTANTVVGTRTLAFLCEKIYAVYDATQVAPAGILGEWTLNQMRQSPIGGDPPQHYALYTMDASTVTVMLDTVPATIYTLTADAAVTIADMTGTGVPVLPLDFHDILFRGALADELEHLEKYDMATYQEAKFEKRLSELRYFIATSNYKDLYQGETGGVNIVQPTVI